MKHTLMALALASLVSPVFAAASAAVTTVTAQTKYDLCDGASGGGKTMVWGGSGQVVTDPDVPVFTRNGFDVQCSSNVFLSAQEESGNLAVVGSGSAKGNQYFGGNSNGGAVTAGGKCTGTNDACTDTDVGTAITAAVAAGSS